MIPLLRPNPKNAVQNCCQTEKRKYRSPRAHDLVSEKTKKRLVPLQKKRSRSAFKKKEKKEDDENREIKRRFLEMGTQKPKKKKK